MNKVLIIGNGPSLTKESIIHFKKNGFITIVCNYYNKLLESTNYNIPELYPDYYCISDAVYFKMNGIDLFQKLPKTTFVLTNEAFQYISDNFEIENIQINLKIVQIQRKSNPKNLLDKVSTFLEQTHFDPLFKTIQFANNTILQIGFPLAVFIKAETIVLLGIDLHNSYLHFYDSDEKSIEKRNSDWKNLWKSVGYSQIPYPKPVDYPENFHHVHLLCWKKVAEILHDLNIHCFNNTPGSRLTLFDTF